MTRRLTLRPGALTLADVRSVRAGGIELELPPDARGALHASADLVARAARGEAPVYGVNTGFGKLANKQIEASELASLQRNLIRSHCVGVGTALDERIVRLVIALKVASLARGYSGVRESVVDALIRAFNEGLYPRIPAQGSVGASGDLAPLAHLTAALMGEGEFLGDIGPEPSARALARARLVPLELGPKEGLALINGTQVSASLALDALLRFEHLFCAAVVAGALTVDAVRGSDVPFDERIHAVRAHPGQLDTARAYRYLLAGSAIRRSHLEGDDRVQDPYSIRCQPQVMGACLDQARYAAQILVREANAVTDNPLVFADGPVGEILSGGNFHAEPVAFAADALAVAIAEVGAIAERRIATLIDTGVSRLPPFLTADAGLNSGFMIAHVTAAALASENKSFAHPASVDSLPTSANQEDHVSMATFAARRLSPMLDNLAHIVGIELLAAAQGIEFLRPLRSSEPLERAHALVRTICEASTTDRALAPQIALAAELAETGRFTDPVRSGGGLDFFPE